MGFGYIITLVPPDRDSITYYTVFQIGRSVLLSCQVPNIQSGVQTGHKSWNISGFSVEPDILLPEHRGADGGEGPLEQVDDGQDGGQGDGQEACWCWQTIFLCRGVYLTGHWTLGKLDTIQL